MKRQEAANQLREQFSRFVTSVRAARAMGQLDLNRILEDVVCPILRITHGMPGLRNLNATERANFPGIDLGDPALGVGVQVTATADAAKIRDTVRACIAHKVYERFPRLLVYVLDEKQASYRVDLSSETSGVLEFDPRSDVLDYRDLLSGLASEPIGKLREVLAVLESEWGAVLPPTGNPLAVVSDELACLSAAPVTLPAELYVADLLPEARPRSSRKSERAAAKAHLDELGPRFGVDWTVHEAQLITFHDLSERDHPLAQLVDAGTVTCLRPVEYYGIGLAYENAFKDLLRRALQQKLYHRGVRWQHQEHLFIFAAGADETLRRSEAWFGEKSSRRRVFEPVDKRDGSGEVSHYKHLAFVPSFHIFESRWYLSFKPEWFFSYDGYHRWRFGAERVDWLKRHEKNQHVFNHLKFLAYFLRHDPPPDLFRDFKPYRFLEIGGLLEFEGGIAIPDAQWQSGEDDDVRKGLADPLEDLPLFGDLDETTSPS